MHCICIINCVLFLSPLSFSQFLVFVFFFLTLLLLLLLWLDSDEIEFKRARSDSYSFIIRVYIKYIFYFCDKCLWIAGVCVILSPFIEKGFRRKIRDTRSPLFTLLVQFVHYIKFVDLNQYNLFNLNNVMSVLWKLIINLLSHSLLRQRCRRRYILW